MVSVAAVYTSLRSEPPSLPDPLERQVVRGTSLNALTPSGAVTLAPSELSWSPVEEATNYSVTLSGVDSDVIWTTDTGGDAFVALPASVSNQLHARVVYFWEVAARAADGGLLANRRTNFIFSNSVP